MDRLWRRVDETAAQVGERFPLYADSQGWTSTASGSWAGGFWAGLLALRAAVDPSPERIGAAVRTRDRLAPWAAQDTVCRGMIFWYGDTVGLLGLADPSPATALAADALARRFDERIGAVPWGTRFPPEHPPLRPDGAAGTVPLLAWSGRRDLAHRHLASHLRDASPRTARDRAWLLLAAAEAVEQLGPEHLPAAAELAAGWAVPVIPQALAGDPRPDTSAAAIAATALIELGDVQGRWKDAGARLLAEILRVGQLPNGGIGHGCYDPDRGIGADHELVWGDFFAALALARLQQVVTAGP